MAENSDDAELKKKRRALVVKIKRWRKRAAIAHAKKRDFLAQLKDIDRCDDEAKLIRALMDAALNP